MTAADDGILVGDDAVTRCFWAGLDPLNVEYHDSEWGRPVVDDTRLFEKICLEGFQSGLSWLTILRKRENFRNAFHGFSPERIARYDDADITRLLGDAGIVRHRGKIEATINNARRYEALVSEFGSLAAYLWQFEPPPDSRPPVLDRDALFAMTTTAESVALSKDLRKRGWAFVGPTTMYAAMQAMGLVNDHVEGCFARPVVERERAALERPTG